MRFIYFAFVLVNTHFVLGQPPADDGKPIKKEDIDWSNSRVDVVSVEEMRRQSYFRADTPDSDLDQERYHIPNTPRSRQSITLASDAHSGQFEGFGDIFNMVLDHAQSPENDPNKKPSDIFASVEKKPVDTETHSPPGFFDFLKHPPMENPGAIPKRPSLFTRKKAKKAPKKTRPEIIRVDSPEVSINSDPEHNKPFGLEEFSDSSLGLDSIPRQGDDAHFLTTHKGEIDHVHEPPKTLLDIFPDISIDDDDIWKYDIGILKRTILKQPPKPIEEHQEDVITQDAAQAKRAKTILAKKRAEARMLLHKTITLKMERENMGQSFMLINPDELLYRSGLIVSTDGQLSFELETGAETPLHRPGWGPGSYQTTPHSLNGIQFLTTTERDLPRIQRGGVCFRSVFGKYYIGDVRNVIDAKNRPQWYPHQSPELERSNQILSSVAFGETSTRFLVTAMKHHLNRQHTLMREIKIQLERVKMAKFFEAKGEPLSQLDKAVSQLAQLSFDYKHSREFMSRFRQIFPEFKFDYKNGIVEVQKTSDVWRLSSQKVSTLTPRDDNIKLMLQLESKLRLLLAAHPNKHGVLEFASSDEIRMQMNNVLRNLDILGMRSETGSDGIKFNRLNKLNIRPWRAPKVQLTGMSISLGDNSMPVIWDNNGMLIDASELSSQTLSSRMKFADMDDATTRYLTENKQKQMISLGFWDKLKTLKSSSRKRFSKFLLKTEDHEYFKELVDRNEKLRYQRVIFNDPKGIRASAMESNPYPLIEETPIHKIAPDVPDATVVVEENSLQRNDDDDTSNDNSPPKSPRFKNILRRKSQNSESSRPVSLTSTLSDYMETPHKEFYLGTDGDDSTMLPVSERPAEKRKVGFRVTTPIGFYLDEREGPYDGMREGMDYLQTRPKKKESTKEPKERQLNIIVDDDGNIGPEDRKIIITRNEAKLREFARAQTFWENNKFKTVVMRDQDGNIKMKRFIGPDGKPTGADTPVVLVDHWTWQNEDMKANTEYNGLMFEGKHPSPMELESRARRLRHGLNTDPSFGLSDETLTAPIDFTIVSDASEVRPVGILKKSQSAPTSLSGSAKSSPPIQRSASLQFKDSIEARRPAVAGSDTDSEFDIDDSIPDPDWVSPVKQFVIKVAGDGEVADDEVKSWRLVDYVLLAETERLQRKPTKLELDAAMFQRHRDGKGQISNEEQQLLDVEVIRSASKLSDYATSKTQAKKNELFEKTKEEVRERVDVMYPLNVEGDDADIQYRLRVREMGPYGEANAAPHMNVLTDEDDDDDRNMAETETPAETRIDKFKRWRRGSFKNTDDAKSVSGVSIKSGTSIKSRLSRMSITSSTSHQSIKNWFHTKGIGNENDVRSSKNAKALKSIEMVDETFWDSDIRIRGAANKGLRKMDITKVLKILIDMFNNDDTKLQWLPWNQRENYLEALTQEVKTLAERANRVRTQTKGNAKTREFVANIFTKLQTYINANRPLASDVITCWELWHGEEADFRRAMSRIETSDESVVDIEIAGVMKLPHTSHSRIDGLVKLDAEIRYFLPLVEGRLYPDTYKLMAIVDNNSRRQRQQFPDEYGPPAGLELHDLQRLVRTTLATAENYEQAEERLILQTKTEFSFHPKTADKMQAAQVQASDKIQDIQTNVEKKVKGFIKGSKKVGLSFKRGWAIGKAREAKRQEVLGEFAKKDIKNAKQKQFVAAAVGAFIGESSKEEADRLKNAKPLTTMDLLSDDVLEILDTEKNKQKKKKKDHCKRATGSCHLTPYRDLREHLQEHQNQFDKIETLEPAVDLMVIDETLPTRRADEELPVAMITKPLPKRKKFGELGSEVMATLVQLNQRTIDRGNCIRSKCWEVSGIPRYDIEVYRGMLEDMSEMVMDTAGIYNNPNNKKAMAMRALGVFGQRVVANVFLRYFSMMTPDWNDQVSYPDDTTNIKQCLPITKELTLAIAPGLLSELSAISDIDYSSTVLKIQCPTNYTVKQLRGEFIEIIDGQISLKDWSGSPMEFTCTGHPELLIKTHQKTKHPVIIREDIGSDSTTDVDFCVKNPWKKIVVKEFCLFGTAEREIPCQTIIRGGVSKVFMDEFGNTVQLNAMGGGKSIIDLTKKAVQAHFCDKLDSTTCYKTFIGIANTLTLTPGNMTLILQCNEEWAGTTHTVIEITSPKTVVCGETEIVVDGTISQTSDIRATFYKGKSFRGLQESSQTFKNKMEFRIVNRPEINHVHKEINMILSYGTDVVHSWTWMCGEFEDKKLSSVYKNGEEYQMTASMNKDYTIKITGHTKIPLEFVDVTITKTATVYPVAEFWTWKGLNLWCTMNSYNKEIGKSSSERFISPISYYRHFGRTTFDDRIRDAILGSEMIQPESSSRNYFDLIVQYDENFQNL